MVLRNSSSCSCVFHNFHCKDHRSKFVGTTPAAIDLPLKSRYLYAVPQEQNLVLLLLMILLYCKYLQDSKGKPEYHSLFDRKTTKNEAMPTATNNVLKSNITITHRGVESHRQGCTKITG